MNYLGCNKLNRVVVERTKGRKWQVNNFWSKTFSMSKVFPHLEPKFVIAVNIISMLGFLFCTWCSPIFWIIYDKLVRLSLLSFLTFWNKIMKHSLTSWRCIIVLIYVTVLSSGIVLYVRSYSTYLVRRIGKAPKWCIVENADLSRDLSCSDLRGFHFPL
jgi:hypothetical protein